MGTITYTPLHQKSPALPQYYVYLFASARYSLYSPRHTELFDFACTALSRHGWATWLAHIDKTTIIESSRTVGLPIPLHTMISPAQPNVRLGPKTSGRLATWLPGSMIASSHRAVARPSGNATERQLSVAKSKA
ncbi:hypothetical protein ACRALDRAFT_206292 [Sodiomyces alcalophilus JCM 7366]|uniref:uncharacterized protein n=1 Tax=Sodiomyces alcalophilus JCM 7366 TaxID=591952 RepID=UPI0039B6A5DE